MNFVYFVNGMVLSLEALMMLFVALVFPATSSVFVIGALIAGAVGGFVALSVSSSMSEMKHTHTFLLTTTVWITATLGGALPLWLWHLSLVDAIFEAMSGITTTGSTVMSGLDGTPRGIILWRAMLQGLGGVGFVVVGIALLPMLKIGGMQLFRSESSEKGEKELATAASFAGATVLVYVGLNLLCAVLFHVEGMSVFDAAIHAMATLSTGGYSSHDASFAYFKSPAIEWTGTLFMVLGAMPFAWFIRAIRRGVYRSEQVEWMLISLAVSIGVISLWLLHTREIAPLDALRLVAFNVVSVVTTTGFVSTDYTAWGPFAVSIFFILTAAGGCTGSTAGGAKSMRWIIMARSIAIRMRRIAYPHSVTVLKYEGRAVEEDVLSGVLVFFLFYCLTIFAIAAGLNLTGLDLATSLSGSLTAVANVGPGVGPVIGPVGNFASLSDVAKLLLTFGMFAGRLEMMTIYVLFTMQFWREI